MNEEILPFSLPHSCSIEVSVISSPLLTLFGNPQCFTQYTLKNCSQYGLKIFGVSNKRNCSYIDIINTFNLADSTSEFRNL